MTNLLNKNLDTKMSYNCKSEFHKQTLESWIKVYCEEPKTYVDITNQYVLYNKSIRINKNNLTHTFLKGNNVNIHNTKILNMLSPQHFFLNLEEFNNKNEL